VIHFAVKTSSNDRKEILSKVNHVVSATAVISAVLFSNTVLFNVIHHQDLSIMNDSGHKRRNYNQSKNQHQ
jgi:hypothetical protein